MSTSSSSSPSSAHSARAVVELSASDLQGDGVVACPNPKMSLWSNHPKVYLGVATAGEVRCPYCGTLYRLKDGETVHGHH